MNEEAETRESDAGTDLSPQTRRILVALDASRHSLTALKAAAELAALMQAELQGLYVEDINLIRLSHLPFVDEIGLYSATQRPYDNRTAEREFRILANQMRRAVAQTAISARVNWSFEVIRGRVNHELLAASNRAELLTLGRVGRTPGKRFGSTAQALLKQAVCPLFLLAEEGLTFPLTVIHTGSPTSDRALKLAATLMRGREGALLLLVATDPQQSEDEREQRAHRLKVDLENDDLNDGLAVQVTIMDNLEQLPQVLHGLQHGTLILPAELAPLLEMVSVSAIFMP